MKFKAKDIINLRSNPSVNSTKIGSIPMGTIVESDEYAWKAVTLPNGMKGYCAATYLQPVQDDVFLTPAVKSKWFAPIRADKFKVFQKFLQPDADTYPK